MVGSMGGVGQRAASVGRMLLDRVAATPDGEAFRYPGPGGAGWQSLTWAETGQQVQQIAAGLLALGLRAEDRVALVAGTRIEWVLADFGILCAGGATTTVYPATNAEEMAYILADAGCRFAIAEDEAQLAKLRAIRDQLPALAAVVTIEPSPPASPNGPDGPGSSAAASADSSAAASADSSGLASPNGPDGEAGPGAPPLDLAELCRRGREHLAAHPDAVANAVDGTGPESLATLIYTSGTTGRPKGVRLVHDCWTYEGAAIAELGMLGPDDLQYFWLPLSHSFGKVLLAAQLAVGFATVVDGRIDKIIDNLGVVRPTFMAGAPRIFEKVHARVAGLVEAEGGLRLRIFRWAFGVGRQVSRLRQQHRRPAPLLAARYAVADRLVFGKIRARFGGRLRFFVSGSAALSMDVAEWFDAAGLLILEGYGLTESSAATFVNRLETARFGTAGLPLPGVEVRLADDGEVLVRGPGVMRGYHGLAEQTSEALDADGWLHTGDVGELLDSGHLRITDRKKDLIKTSGGKYVAPQPIEVVFAALCPLASHIVVHGDGRNYCTALITLDPDELADWAGSHGLAGADYAELAGRADVRAIVEAAVKALNERLNRWETIKDFRVLDHDLTVEAGELTPSMKLKRRVVENRYAALLGEMYPVPAQR
jgi:long-chain acyl-CoA synthetase